MVIVGWALVSGALPGPSDLLHLPTVDWSWPYRHQYVSAIVLSVLIIGSTVVLVRLQDRLSSFWSRVGQGFAILRDRRRYAIHVVSWQTGSWVLRFASVYWFLKAFHMPASSHNVFLVLAVQSISTLLPITPGGVGTVQGLLVFAFRETVAASIVLGFSVGMHIATVATNLALGFAAIGTMLGTLRWRRLIGRERPVAEH